MYVGGVWIEEDNRLVVDFDAPTTFRPVKEHFHVFLRRAAGDEGAVLWDRDVAPYLANDDVPWSVHAPTYDYAGIYGANALLAPCARVYLRKSAALFNPFQKRWWLTKNVRTPPTASDLLVLVNDVVNESACPQCGAAHQRGLVNGITHKRCLTCGISWQVL